MKLNELKIVQENVDILNSILIARETCGYDPEKPQGTLYGSPGPFALDPKTNILFGGKTIQISRNLLGRFFYEAEEYYRNKLAEMGIENIKLEKSK
jgi:hypothetical protein